MNEYKQLVEAAIEARERSYSPYSQFKVGAALQGTEGSIITGCNVENASYGLSICAERAAICRAFAQGIRTFQAIAIAASPLASPCGACRQFLVEFGNDITVISVDVNDPARISQWQSGELIPDSFTFPENRHAN